MASSSQNQSELYPRSLSLSHRRKLVIARIALGMLALTWWIVFRKNAPIHNFGLLAISLLHIGVGFGLFWKSTVWRLSNAPADRLDERERQVQTAAYVTAYRYVVLVLILAAIGLTEMAPNVARELLDSLGTPWFILVVISTLFLPSDIIAWQEREL
jgi:hypothetical protein